MGSEEQHVMGVQHGAVANGEVAQVLPQPKVPNANNITLAPPKLNHSLVTQHSDNINQNQQAECDVHK